MLMRLDDVAAVGVVVTAVTGFLIATPNASASTYGIELNGSYSVTSNGDWAETNDSYRDEQTVRQTWTISSSCTGPTQCTGNMVSDQGWTAPIKFTENRWIVTREIPNWAPCGEGPPATGHQMFMFWGVDNDGKVNATNTSQLGGRERTNTDSGSCGISKPLVITMPVRLEKLS
jgi:hypothetical protein